MPPVVSARGLIVRVLAASALLPGLAWAEAPEADPLPSWNDGPAKRSIVDFVRRVSDPAAPDHVAPVERIAVMESAEHPRFKQRYDRLAYQPMQEVLALLRAHGFKTWIVSGGGADFMRVWSERVYGIPPEQVVGSTGRTRFEMRDDRPTLHYTTVGHARPTLGVIIHHTDGEREYAYDANPQGTGRLVEALAEAPRRGWTVVDMKRDWASVFAPQCAARAAANLEARPDVRGP